MNNRIILITKDKDEFFKPVKLNYKISGFNTDTWFAIFLNSSRFVRFKTDLKGEALGSVCPIPESNILTLDCIGNISAKLKKNNSIPLSGIIYGATNVIKDDEDESRNGIWSIDLRYD